MVKSLFLKAWSRCLVDPRHLDIFKGHSHAFQLGIWLYSYWLASPKSCIQIRRRNSWKPNPKPQAYSSVSCVLFFFLTHSCQQPFLLWIWQCTHPSSCRETSGLLAAPHPTELCTRRTQRAGGRGWRTSTGGLWLRGRDSSLSSCQSSVLFFFIFSMRQPLTLRRTDLMSLNLIKTKQMCNFFNVQNSIRNTCWISHKGMLKVCLKNEVVCF